MIKLETHHIRYLELHGEDEIIMLSREEHIKAHVQDRANGFKSIPIWIVRAAAARTYGQTNKGKASSKRRIAKYEHSEAGKAARMKYEQSEAGKAVRAKHSRTEERMASARIASAKYRQSEKAKVLAQSDIRKEAARVASAKYRQKQKDKMI